MGETRVVLGGDVELVNQSRIRYQVSLLPYSGRDGGSAVQSGRSHKAETEMHQ